MNLERSSELYEKKTGNGNEEIKTEKTVTIIMHGDDSPERLGSKMMANHQTVKAFSPKNFHFPASPSILLLSQNYLQSIPNFILLSNESPSYFGCVHIIMFI